MINRESYRRAGDLGIWFQRDKSPSQSQWGRVAKEQASMEAAAGSLEHAMHTCSAAHPKATPNDILPPARPHLSNLPTQGHQWGNIYVIL